MNLEREDKPLKYVVHPDKITPEAIAPFDLTMDEPTEFYPWKMPELPEDYSIGLIVGASGTGKSLLLKEFPGFNYIGGAFHPFYSVVSQVGSTAKEASEKMYAVGLNSIPKWKLPIIALSNGEQHRAHVAKRLHDDGVIDEFTSTIDRDVAISLSVSVSRYIGRNNIKRMVFATCHRDIVAPLRPDWIIDTDAGRLTFGGTPTPRWHGHIRSWEPEGSIELSWN